MAEMKIDVFAPGKGPDLSCGRDYTVQATVTQKVESCEEVDFNDLYDLVEKMVDAECQAVTCTVPCNRLGPFILGQTWSCANSLAEVSLAKRVFCSKDTTSNFPYPQRPTQQDLRKKDPAAVCRTRRRTTMPAFHGWKFRRAESASMWC